MLSVSVVMRVTSIWHALVGKKGSATELTVPAAHQNGRGGDGEGSSDDSDGGSGGGRALAKRRGSKPATDDMSDWSSRPTTAGGDD